MKNKNVEIGMRVTIIEDGIIHSGKTGVVVAPAFLHARDTFAGWRVEMPDGKLWIFQAEQFSLKTN